MPVQLLDLYHGNNVTSFHAIADSGVVGIVFKATQGTSVVDPAFSSYVSRAKACDLLAGAYHFFDPDADPVLQAEHFHNTAQMGAGTLGLWLDVETLSKSSPENIGAHAAKASDRLKALTGHYPGIYASDSFYQSYLKADFPVGYYKLWIAKYSVQRPATPCQIWQYSESGTVNGVDGAVDRDSYNGTLGQLKTELVLP